MYYPCACGLLAQCVPSRIYGVFVVFAVLIGSCGLSGGEGRRPLSRTLVASCPQEEETFSFLQRMLGSMCGWIGETFPPHLAHEPRCAREAGRRSGLTTPYTCLTLLFFMLLLAYGHADWSSLPLP